MVLNIITKYQNFKLFNVALPPEVNVVPTAARIVTTKLFNVAARLELRVPVTAVLPVNVIGPLIATVLPVNEIAVVAPPTTNVF